MFSQLYKICSAQLNLATLQQRQPEIKKSDAVLRKKKEVVKISSKVSSRSGLGAGGLPKEGCDKPLVCESQQYHTSLFS